MTEGVRTQDCTSYSVTGITEAFKTKMEGNISSLIPEQDYCKNRQWSFKKKGLLGFCHLTNDKQHFS